MVDFQVERFRFVSLALPSDALRVIRFKGIEGLSRCYEFDIQLISKDPEINIGEVLANPAVFTILRDEGDIPFHGILSQFEQLHSVDEMVFYRAVLVPRLWWLSLTHHNRIFLKKTVPETISSVVKDGGILPGDFELRLQGSYEKREYVCQYGESHLGFVQRWMEREGMYYYFDQTGTGEKVVITDTQIAHTAMSEGGVLIYSPPSGLDADHREEVIKSFYCDRKLLPKTVVLKDYNYRKPSLELSAEANVYDRGRGQVYLYGEHFGTPEEGSRLARIRAEELRCWEKRFRGESSVPFLRPGYTFNLQEHYRDDFNQRYLTVELAHQGSQAAYLLSGLSRELADDERKPYYRNRFTAIPASVQFRAERRSERPHIHGVINARIDAAGSGQYAELDDQGRYKVVMPFDLSGRSEGKASTPLRMVQPYAGSDHGMHFPLHKGTEVLVSFIDGDPDRPFIAGAVPNPETPSPVTSANPSTCSLDTGGGNSLRIEDRQGSQRMVMQSPTESSWLRIGAPNDPPSPWYDAYFKPDDKSSGFNKGGFTLSTAGSLGWLVGLNWSIQVGGNKTTIIVGGNELVVGGYNNRTTIGEDLTFIIGWTSVYRTSKTTMRGVKNAAEEMSTQIAGSRTGIAEATNKLTASNTDVAQSRIDFNQVNTVMGEVGTKITEAQNEMTQLKTEMSQTDTAISQADTEIGQARNSVSQMATKFENWDTSIRQASGRVQILEERTGAISNRIEQVRSEIAQSKQQVSGGMLDN